MTMKQGYKQTKVGVIPRDWSFVELGSVANPRYKWSFTGGPFGSNLKSSDYTDDGVRIIQLQNIGDGKFQNDYEIYTSKEKANELLSCNIYPGDIILSKMGDPVARACIIPNYHDCYVMCSDGIRLAVDPRRFDTYFIYVLINESRFRALAESASTGSTRKRIGLNELRKLELLCPKLEEQTAIAEALSDADAWIESLEKLIAKKRDTKQGAMQELLKPKNGWRVCCLGDVLEIMHGKSQHSVEERNGVYPILATGGQIGTTNQFLYDKPSVLIGRKGTIDCPQYIDQPFWTIDTLFYSIIRYPNCPRYIYYQFCLIDWAQYNEASGVPSLGARTIEGIKISMPSPEEQERIANIMTVLDSEISALETKLTKARQIKQGMMHNLLTGRIRLV